MIGAYVCVYRGIFTSKTTACRYKLLIRNTELLDFHPAHLQRPHGTDTTPGGGDTVSAAPRGGCSVPAG